MYIRETVLRRFRKTMKSKRE